MGRQGHQHPRCAAHKSATHSRHTATPEEHTAADTPSLMTPAALALAFALLIIATSHEREPMTAWNKDFLIALLERTVATFVVTFLAATGLDAGAIGETGLDGIKWSAALATAGVAAGLSLIKGVLANLAT